LDLMDMGSRLALPLFGNGKKMKATGLGGNRCQ
jgi:hypothetical protein